MAESAQGAPGRGVPADDKESASQYEREPQLSRDRKLLSQNDRGDQRNEQRHKTGISKSPSLKSSLHQTASARQISQDSRWRATKPLGLVR